MSSPDNPYYEQDVVRFDPTFFDMANQDGLEMSLYLEAGKTSLLPDGVRGWLYMHTLGINTSGIAAERAKIDAELTQPPYDRDKAVAVGRLVRDTIQFGYRCRDLILEADRRNALLWGMPPEDGEQPPNSGV